MKVVTSMPSQLGNYDVGVVEYGNNRAMMELIDGQLGNHAFSISRIDNMHELPLFCTHTPTYALTQGLLQQSNVLIAGLGAGLVHTQLQRFGHKVLTVEPDSTVEALARAYWEFQGDVFRATIEEAVEGWLQLSTPARPSFAAAYLNHYCKVKSVAAHQASIKLLDGVMSLIVPGGKIVINAFNYEEEPEVSSLIHWAAGRGFKYTETVCMTDSESGPRSKACVFSYIQKP